MTGANNRETPPARSLTIGDVDRLDGDSFEIFSSLLFTKQGYLAQVTEKKRGDGGIDLVGIKNGSGVLVQCKSSQSSKIGWDAVKEVVGGAMRYQVRYPSVRFKRVAITNQYFNETAIEQASLNQVELINRDEINALLEINLITDLDLDELLLSST